MEEAGFLKSVMLFVEFDETELQELRNAMRVHRYGADDVILAEGSANRALHVIRDGRVRVSQRVGDRDVALCDLVEGQTFGELSIIEDGFASASLVAVSETEVWSLAMDDLASFLRLRTTAASKFWRAIAVDLRRRLLQTNEVVQRYYEANRMIIENPTFREAYALCNR